MNKAIILKRIKQTSLTIEGNRAKQKRHVIFTVFIQKTNIVASIP